MASPDGTYLAIVRGRTTGEEIDLAANLSYALLVNFPHGPVEMSGIVPSEERWEGDDLRVRAFAPGTPVLVASIRGQLQIMARELPHREPCPSPSRSSPTKSLEVLDAIRHMTPAQVAELRSLLR